MIRSALLAATAATALVPAATRAQQVTDLGEIVVSGGLSPIAAARYGRAASVVTAADIEDRGLVTVQDALRDVPGVSINGTGTSEKVIRIRGGEANHTLVLIDGVEAAGGDSAYQLGGLDVANIDRIEVLRGPQSAFYGSNASAGVVNIITRTGGEGTTLRGSLATGDATVASAFMARRGARGGVSLALSHIDDRGFDVSGDGGELDGLRRSTAILSGDRLLGDDLKIGATLRGAREHYDYDTAGGGTDANSYVVDSGPTVDRREITGAVFAEYTMLDGRLVHRLAVEGTRNDLDPDDRASTDARRTAVKYRLSYGIDGPVADADHLLNLLVERQRDSSTVNPGYNRAATSVAVEYRASLDNGLNVQAGLRHDNNETFDNATSWNVGLSYALASGVRLHGSAGTGIVNPEYFELFADAFGYVGNPALAPERNRSFDIGAELPLLDGRGSIDVTYFRETLTDEITAVFSGGAFTFVNQSGDSDREGVEVTGTLRATDALSLRLAYTYLDASNPDGSVEIRRPRNQLALGGTVRTFAGRGTVSADLRHVSGNYRHAVLGRVPDGGTSRVHHCRCRRDL